LKSPKRWWSAAMFLCPLWKKPASRTDPFLLTTACLKGRRFLS
jgi:hypothetical protein